MWRRALRIVLITALALQLTYLVVANLLLMTPRLRTAVPELSKGTTRCSWDRAWTLWWGHVHVRGFSFQFDDQHTLQLDLRAERGEAGVSLLALFRHHVLLERPRASGITLRLGVKVPEETVRAVPRRIAAFPPVPGFKPPSEQPYRAKTPVDPEHYDEVWSYELRGVRVDVDDLWVDEAHYVGHAHVEGSFDFEPFRSLWADVQAQLTPGALEAGPHVVSRDFAADLDVHVSRVGMDPEHPGNLARATSGALRLDAGLPGLDVLELYSDDVHLRSGNGQLSARVQLVRGRLQQGSMVEAKVLNVDGTAAHFDFKGQLDAVAHADGGRLLAHASASTDVRLPMLETGRVRARSGPISARAALGPSDLGAPEHFDWLEVRLPRAAVPDTRPLLALVKKHVPQLRFKGGPLTGSVNVLATQDRVRVELGNLKLGDVRAAAGAVRVHRQWKGALEVRIPGLAIGLWLADGKVHPAPVWTEGWLPEQLERLGIHPRKGQAPGS